LKTVKEDLDKHNSKAGARGTKSPWTNKEIASLIYGVFRFGENDWNELKEVFECFKGQTNGGHAEAKKRTPNEMAQKWRQIK